MRELIRHILKENRLQQEMKQFIEDNNIFDVAEMVGGLDNLKSIFKDDLEFSEILNGLTGVVDFEYHDAFKDPRFVVFPIKYEIIGVEKNIWGTHSWPELNLIYDDSKLTSAEKKKLITILATIQNDNTVGKIETNLPEIESSGYFDVKQINGKDVDLHEDEFPFSKEDVIKIHDKLYGESESLNESNNSEIDKNLKAINVLLSLVSWDGLCDIWAEYNPDDKEYEIRSKTLSTDDLATSITEIEKELNSLEDSIKSMGIKVYIYTPWYVDNCEDEVKFMNESLKESESEDKDYSPAGKEITPNHIVVHKSNPMYRDKIMENGLKVRAGECYKIYVGYGVKCKPAIFATNSTNKRAWFDSTYDDDIWFIDTTKIPDVKWFKDRHFESRSKHIVTFQDIPKEAITLKYEGTGSSEDILKSWPEDSPNKLQESIRRILRGDSLNNDLMESESKSEDKKLNLVKEMIYSFFDEVEFIEVDTNYEGKPLIKIYHDVEDTAANYDNWLQHQIRDKIQEITGDGIILSPWWAPKWDINKKLADFYIDVQKIEYDDEGNVINESDESKQERKFNKLIQNVEDYLNSNEYPSVKKFTVYYDDTHDDVIVNIFFNVQDSIKLGGGINSVIKRVGKQVMEDLEVFPMDFKYHIHFDRDINESKKKSTNELIITVLNTLVLPQYEHVICGFELKNVDDKSLDNIINYPGVTVTFIGGYGTKMWPKTQAVQKMYNDVLDDIWETVWDYTGVSLELYSKYVKDCGKENIYLREQKEKTNYIELLKDIVEPFKNEDCVCDIRVLYNEEDDMYLIDVEIGLFDLKEKFFAEVGRNYYVKKLRVDIKEAIKGYIPIDNFYVGSYSTPKCGEKRWWDKNINESDNKEQSLQKLIDQHGLYDFIKMSGLDFNQVKSILNKMDNPKEILKQYIREFVLEHDGMSNGDYGSLFALRLPLSNIKYVNDIMVQDRDQIAVEIWGYEEDEYGHTEQTEQYLTSINNLTNEELLSILSWMMETIEGGYWD